MSTHETTIPVSVIILTYNEEVNIKECVESLYRFDEIIVVDSGSSDQTRNIIESQFSHVRLFENAFEDFGQQRNWALEHTDPRNPWILFVDADEFMEEPLASEIEAFVIEPCEIVGAFIAGRNYFLGTWLKRCTFYPSYQLRLLKLGHVKYRKEGHGQREIAEGPCTYLKKTWRHEAFSQGVEQWILRHNQYSSAEIDLIARLRGEAIVLGNLMQGGVSRRREIKKLAARVPGRPFVRLFYTYFLRFGFLDGRAGFYFCLLRFAHECHIVVKLAEKRALGGS